MARIRSLKPEYATSEAMAELSIPCMMHFALLWTYADDEGRGIDNPRLIKAAIWPLRDEIGAAEVEDFQCELAKHGRIVRYESGGKRLFQIANFTEHQRPQKPSPSSYDPPPIGLLVESGTDTGTLWEDDGSDTGDLPSVVVVGEGVVEGVVVGDGGGAGEDSSPPAPSARSLAIVPASSVADQSPLLPTGFDAFWAHCPRKAGKPKAETAWTKALRRGATEAELIAGMDRWAEYWTADGTDVKYIPHPSTWLNSCQWQDETPPTKRRAAGSKPSYDDHVSDFIARNGLGFSGEAS